jgi:hypothetical protein
MPLYKTIQNNYLLISEGFHLASRKENQKVKIAIFRTIASFSLVDIYDTSEALPASTIRA